MIRALPINEGKIGINAVTQVHPVSVILAGCQDEPLLTEQARVNIDRSLALDGERGLQLIGGQFDSGEVFDRYQVEEAADLTLEVCPHLLLVIAGVGERVRLSEKIRGTELFEEGLQGLVTDGETAEEQPHNEFRWEGLAGKAHVAVSSLELWQEVAPTKRRRFPLHLPPRRRRDWPAGPLLPVTIRQPGQGLRRQ